MTRLTDEQYEQAMDAQFSIGWALHRGDLYDAVQDARSEARYEWNDADREAEDVERHRWES